VAAELFARRPCRADPAQAADSFSRIAWHVKGGPAVRRAAPPRHRHGAAPRAQFVAERCLRGTITKRDRELADRSSAGEAFNVFCLNAVAICAVSLTSRSAPA